MAPKPLTAVPSLSPSSDFDFPLLATFTSFLKVCGAPAISQKSNPADGSLPLFVPSIVGIGAPRVQCSPPSPSITPVGIDSGNEIFECWPCPLESDVAPPPAEVLSSSGVNLSPPSSLEIPSLIAEESHPTKMAMPLPLWASIVRKDVAEEDE